jgi:hypothetical protein
MTASHDTGSSLTSAPASALLWRRLGAGFFGLAALVVMACTSADPKASPKLCTPGANVFCRCADRSEGTKLCDDKGQSFGPCRLGENTPCPGGELPPEDAGAEASENTCPGAKIALTAERPIDIQGDTSTATDEFKGDMATSCAVGDGSPDHVYQITPAATGKLDVELVPDGFDGIVYMRKDPCGNDGRQVKCGASSPSGVREVLAGAAVVVGVPYYIVVDGAGAANKGKYLLNLKLTPGPVCGDEKVTQGETCDDGSPEDDNDGCTRGCTNVSGNPDNGNACPGQPVHLWKSGTPTLARVTGRGSTDPANNPKAANNWKATGTGCDVVSNDVNTAPDRIYAVTVHDTGRLNVSATGSAGFNLQLIARTRCDDRNSQPASAGANTYCANNAGASSAAQTETMEFPVVRDTTYYVAVDGVLGGKGDYTINFELK